MVTKPRKRPREPILNPKTTLLAPTPWVGIPDDLEGFEGYVYCIRHKRTGKAYIGRKYFWSCTRVKVAGRKNRKRKKSESNWRHYKSSSDEVKKAIVEEGLDAFDFEVLHLCRTRKETNYRELEEQVKRDVLTAMLPNGDFAYWNGNILARYFRE